MDVLLPELFVGQLRAARLSPCEDIFVAVLAKTRMSIRPLPFAVSRTLGTRFMPAHDP